MESILTTSKQLTLAGKDTLHRSGRGLVSSHGFIKVDAMQTKRLTLQLLHVKAWSAAPCTDELMCGSSYPPRAPNGPAKGAHQCRL